MTKIPFVNGTTPAINDTNLNQMQTNIENAINALKPVVLYTNNTGTTGNVTLSETAANFEYLEIFYLSLSDSGTGYAQNSTKVYQPNNKSAWLTTGYADSRESADTFNVKICAINISGTSLTKTYGGGWEFSDDNKYKSNNIAITRVLGYR